MPTASLSLWHARVLNFSGTRATTAAPHAHSSCPRPRASRAADCEGSARFFLTRTVGKQTVRVDVDCTPLPVDDEECTCTCTHACPRVRVGARLPAHAVGRCVHAVHAVRDCAWAVACFVAGAVEDREGEEEEESEEQAEGFRVLVTVSEEGKSKVMQFGGMASTYLQLHRVALFDADKAPTPDQVFGGFDEAPVYAGPAFDELDEALKNAFYEYLSARGVDDAFADKLAAYSCDKERVRTRRAPDAAACARAHCCVAPPHPSMHMLACDCVFSLSHACRRST
ncbi:hypothetical protein EON67_06295 [archaeon]|nr:MAG: hypothetical protein EON67_06295 [archaeon]